MCKNADFQSIQGLGWMYAEYTHKLTARKYMYAEATMNINKPHRNVWMIKGTIRRPLVILNHQLMVRVTMQSHDLTVFQLRLCWAIPMLTFSH